MGDAGCVDAMKTGFDPQTYLTEQSRYILERVRIARSCIWNLAGS